MSIRKVLFLALALVGILGFFACLVMTVSAVAAMEWGRVVFYGFGALLCMELVIYCYIQVKD